jgi:predicted nucleic acid-binding protein
LAKPHVIDRPTVVDSDVLIDYFAGISPSAEAVEELLEADRLALTTLTVFELNCGVQSEESANDIELLVDASRLVLRLSIDSTKHASRQFRQLRDRGHLISTPDLLIAGCCLAAELPLLTRNQSQFSSIPQLELLIFDEN